MTGAFLDKFIYVNAVGMCSRLPEIGSGNGLMPEPMFTQVHVAIYCH